MFNLSDAPEGNTLPVTVYQKTGIFDNVVISEVVLEHSSKAGVPYMRVITQGVNGEIGSGPKMYFSTDVKEGKRTSGWGVTARSLTDWIMSTHNVDEVTAQDLMKEIPTIDAAIKKVSALLVGRKFRAKFKGETSQKGNIYAILAQTESMQVPLESSRLKYSADYDIKPYTGITQQVIPSGNDLMNSTVNNDSLPF